jgi:hypothetical protein
MKIVVMVKMIVMMMRRRRRRKGFERNFPMIIRMRTIENLLCYNWCRS